MALIILAMLCLAILLVTFVANWSSSADKDWLKTVLQILGNAISGVAGAVVGASTTTGARRKRT